MSLGAVGLLAGARPAGAAARSPVADAQAQLSAAVSVRQQAEDRLAQLEIRRTDLQAKLADGSKRTTGLAAQVAAAREAARQSAVDAYVSGGDATRLAAVLSSDGSADASAKSTYIANQAQNALDDAEHYRALREESGQSVDELGSEIDDLNQEIADATSDAEQASAIEADAERQVAQADAAAQQAAVLASSPTPATTKPASSPKHRAPATTTTRPSTRRSSPTSTTTTTTTPQSLGSGSSSGTGSGSSTSTTTSYPPGTTAAEWASLRKCESGGNYQAVSASGRYRGAYQFDQQTWESVGGSGDPAAASPAEQDQRAGILYERRGPRAWPVCGLVLPDL